MDRIISVEEYFDSHNVDNIVEFVKCFANQVCNNMKNKILEKLDNPYKDIDYDIMDECDRFVNMLCERTGNTKEYIESILQKQL